MRTFLDPETVAPRLAQVGSEDLAAAEGDFAALVEYLVPDWTVRAAHETAYRWVFVLQTRSRDAWACLAIPLSIHRPHAWSQDISEHHWWKHMTDTERRNQIRVAFDAAPAGFTLLDLWQECAAFQEDDRFDDWVYQAARLTRLLDEGEAVAADEGYRILEALNEDLRQFWSATRAHVRRQPRVEVFDHAFTAIEEHLSQADGARPAHSFVQDIAFEVNRHLIGWFDAHAEEWDPDIGPGRARVVEETLRVMAAHPEIVERARNPARGLA